MRHSFLAGCSGLNLSACLQGLSYEEATSNFWVLDADGLVTVKREKQLSATVEPFARKTQADPEGENLVDTVKRVCSRHHVFPLQARLCQWSSERMLYQGTPFLAYANCHAYIRGDLLCMVSKAS